MARRRLRFTNGSLALQSTKLQFRLNPATGQPIDLWTYPMKESNNLVEEYMLLANQIVAEHLVKWCGNYAFLRNHPPPLQRALDKFRDFARSVGYDVDTSSAGTHVCDVLCCCWCGLTSDSHHSQAR
jgi:exoribonuclease R